MKEFASVLKENRLRAGLTQKDLAERVNLDHSYISKIERLTTVPPSRENVIAIADALAIENEAQRVSFLLAAGCANLEDFERVKSSFSRELTPQQDLPFGTGALNFPNLKKIEESELLERIRQLLNHPNISPEKRMEYLDIIRSFIEWLEYRINQRLD